MHRLRSVGWGTPTREIGCGRYYSVSRQGTILYYIYFGFMEEYGCCGGGCRCWCLCGHIHGSNNQLSAAAGGASQSIVSTIVSTSTIVNSQQPPRFTSGSWRRHPRSTCLRHLSLDQPTDQLLGGQLNTEAKVNNTKYHLIEHH